MAQYDIKHWVLVIEQLIYQDDEEPQFFSKTSGNFKIIFRYCGTEHKTFKKLFLEPVKPKELRMF